MRTRRIDTIILALAVACAPMVAAYAQHDHGAVSRRKKPPAKKEKKLTKKEKKIARELRYANFLMNVERDYKGAAKQFAKVLKLDKKHRAAFMGMVQAHIKAKDHKSAVTALKKMTKQQPRDREAWYALGQAYATLSQRDDAKAAYEKVVELDKRFAPALKALGDMYYSEYRRAKTPELAEKVKEYYGGYLGSTKLRKGKAAKRIERIVTELRDGPIAAAYLDARQLYNQAYTVRFGISGYFDRSYKALEKVLASKPKHKGALYYQGLIHLSVKSKTLHDVDKARAKFTAAGRHSPSLTELGRLARLDDDLTNAVDLLKKAVVLDRGYQKAYLELGRAYKLKGERDEAVKAFQKAYDIDRRTDLAGKSAVELSIIAPQDRRVLNHFRSKGRFEQDIFNTEKFKASIKQLERRLGGVDSMAAEQVWLDKMMRRLITAADFSVPFVFQVKVVNTKMINAFAVPNGNIYFTRGFLNMVHEMFPNMAMDENNAAVASVMGHEITHVTKEHVVRSFVFRDALKTGRFTPSSLVSVTRTHEIEADREGMKLMFLAGYDPRFAIQMFEAYAKKLGEIPAGLDHPTFDERIHYLEEYWGNEMAFAYSSFHHGVHQVKEAHKHEAKDLNKAAKLFQGAIEDFKRFAVAFKHTKEALNNLGLSYAKLGIYTLAKLDKENTLGRWYTDFSVEPALAMKFTPLKRKRKTRGAAQKKKARLPTELRQAKTFLKKALKADESYVRARFNYAIVLLAMGEPKKAEHQLARVKADCREGCALKPEQVDNLLAVARAEMGRVKDAVAHFEAAVKAHPEGIKKAPRVFNLAVALEKQGDKEAAKKAYEQYIKLAEEAGLSGVFPTRAKDALERL